LGLLNENVLNGAILMILVTCLISSFVTENAGRKLAIIESEKTPLLSETPERILVPISNPATIEQLVDLAILIKNPKSREPLYPLVVVKDDNESRERITANAKMLDRAIKHAAATETAVQVVSRIDLNVANGIFRAIRELMITEVVIGWNGQVTARERIFGTVLDNLLQDSRQMVLVSKISHPLNVVQKIVVVAPLYAELETGFRRWVQTVKTLAKQTGARVEFFAAQQTLISLETAVAKTRPAINAVYRQFTDWEDFLIISREIQADDLLLLISARQDSISHNRYLDALPAKLGRHFEDNSFVIVYPEQNAITPTSGLRRLDTVAPVLPLPEEAAA
jgi:hypothetical protein